MNSNTAAIADLTAEVSDVGSWNTSVEELTERVGAISGVIAANTADISSLTSTVDSDHATVSNGMDLLSDHFTVNSYDMS